MSKQSLSYTLRMPSDLRRLLEVEAKRTGESVAALVVRGCWMVLEPVTNVTPQADTVTTVTPSIDALRAICAGAVQPLSPEPTANPCPHREYDDQTGDTFTCCLTLGHKGKCQSGHRLATD
jgi:hypothetical protein